jgi:hypothetical protein
MELGGALIRIFVAVIFIGVMFWAVTFFMSKIFVISQQAVPLSPSPLEDRVYVLNSDECGDSDGGVFFMRRGKVNFVRSIFFIKWTSRVEDNCSGEELTEYYCGEEGIARGVVQCENGCQEGKCVE